MCFVALEGTENRKFYIFNPICIKMNLREYTKGIENYKEKEESGRKVHRAFDEDENLLFHDVGSVGGGAYWDNCIFYCSKCFKKYFSRGHLKRHAIKCLGLFGEGIHKITKYPPKIKENFINTFGRMSKIVQGIDFSMSSEEAIRKADKTVLFLVESKRPGGFITFCKRNFKNEDKISIEDFFVLEYQRRKGFGETLFYAMLKELNMEDNKDVINKNLAVNKPSISLSKFLIKKGYLEMGIW